MVIDKFFDSLINADTEVIKEITGFTVEGKDSHKPKKKEAGHAKPAAHGSSGGHGGGGHH